MMYSSIKVSLMLLKTLMRRLHGYEMILLRECKVAYSCSQGQSLVSSNRHKTSHVMK